MPSNFKGLAQNLDVIYIFKKKIGEMNLNSES